MSSIVISTCIVMSMCRMHLAMIVPIRSLLRWSKRILEKWGTMKEDRELPPQVSVAQCDVFCFLLDET